MPSGVQEGTEVVTRQPECHPDAQTPLVYGRNVDEVARGARHGVPLEHRDVRLIAGRAEVDVGARVDEVVAHVEVLDARRRHRRHLVERLRRSWARGSRHRRCRPRRPRGRASSTCCRGTRPSERATSRPSAACSRPSSRARSRLEELTSTSYFVAPGTAVQENCGSKNSVAATRSVTTRRRHRRPRVVEGRDRRRCAEVALRVDRDDVPVVRPRRQEREARHVVRRPGLDRLSAVLDDVRERGVAREREHVAGGIRNRRPADGDRGDREGEREARDRRLRGRHRPPRLDQRARGSTTATRHRPWSSPGLATSTVPFGSVFFSVARVLRVAKLPSPRPSTGRVEVLVGCDLELVAGRRRALGSRRTRAVSEPTRPRPDRAEPGRSARRERARRRRARLQPVRRG